MCFLGGNNRVFKRYFDGFCCIANRLSHLVLQKHLGGNVHLQMGTNTYKAPSASTVKVKYFNHSAQNLRTGESHAGGDRGSKEQFFHSSFLSNI
jgi:hypothetical protein